MIQVESNLRRPVAQHTAQSRVTYGSDKIVQRFIQFGLELLQVWRAHDSFQRF